VHPVAIYVASRAVVLAAAAAAGVLRPPLPLSRALLRWDSGWYLLTAMDGYPSHVTHHAGHVAANTTAFFPLFPYSIRALTMATGLSFQVAGLVLSSVFGLLAGVLVWLLCRHLWGRAAADRGCAAFCFFPGTFVFSMVYSEGLMIALAAACLWALLSRRYLAAGILAAVATATRPNAVALVVACAWVAAVAVWRRREWRSLLAPALAPLGILGFLAFLWYHTGDWKVWFQTEAGGWKQHVSFTLWPYLQSVARHFPFPDLNVAVAVAGLLFLVGAGAVLLASRVPVALVLYAAVVVALTLVTPQPLFPRFLLTAFPLVVGLGYRLKGGAFGGLIGLSAAGLVLLAMISMSTIAITP
ncbi:MAG: mannosyltransferase family protein, partial [Acidimicrobiales bacterium]